MEDRLFKIPQALDYKGDAKNWKKFKQQFDIYMKASGLDKNDSENKVNIFLNIAGEEALEIFDNLNLNSEERKDYELVIQGFETHCTAKENEIYKRFKFFTRAQQPSEFFSEFYDDLLVMASFCNFGNQKERLVRDRIIAGIRNPVLQEKFLSSPDLTLEEVVNICMDQEVDHMSSGLLKTEAPIEILNLENDDGESNNNYDELTNVPMEELDQIHIPNEILYNDLATEEEYHGKLNLEFNSDAGQTPDFEDIPELEETPDVEERPDVKPTNTLNKSPRTYSKRRKLSDSIELSTDDAIPVFNEIEYEESPLLESSEEEPKFRKKTRSSQKNQIDIKTKIAEVKKKISNIAKFEAIAKRVLPKRKTRSNKKNSSQDEMLDLMEDNFNESDESLMEYYEIPVEDQEEYSEIQHVETEVQEQYSEIQPMDTEENSEIRHVDTRDQEDNSKTKHVDTESSPLHNNSIEIECSSELSENGYEQYEFTEEEVEETKNEESVGTVNKKYLLEQKTNVPPKRKRKRRTKNGDASTANSVHKTEIIKIERNDLPPFILRSFRKKTLLLSKMPYPCKKCDATFWTSFQLERHQLVHVLKKVPPPTRPPSKVFKCEVCSKQFKKICDLERHTRVHTGEKPSVCNICNKRFQQAYNLNKHLYTHTQEKNFECVICQKKFGRNDVLNRHVLTHSIIKPFKCSICSRTFIRNSQLKLHLRKHHNLDKDPGSQVIDDPGNDDESVAGTSTTE